jgi:hypothetical protein
MAKAAHGARFCGLTFEVTGPARRAAWPVRRMMTDTAARAKTHAVAGPVDRGVRPRWAVRRLGGAGGGRIGDRDAHARERTAAVAIGHPASAGREFSCDAAQARGSSSTVRAADCA